MFKARDLNSATPLEEIEAENYQKSAEADLRCPCCEAKMVHVRAAKPSSVFATPAHFRTAVGETHDADCKAYQEERYINRISKTINGALEKGDFILLSLNDVENGFGLPKNLDRTFHGVADPAYKQTELYDFKVKNCGRFKQEPINSIFALMTIFNLIDKQKGPPAFNRVYLTWRGQVLPYEKVILSADRDIDQDKDLFHDIYGQAKNKAYPHRFSFDNFEGAYGFPRVVEMRLTQSKHKKDNHRLFGPSHVVAHNAEGKCSLRLEHIVEIKSDALRDRLLSGHENRLLATPRINRTYAKRAFNDFHGGRDSFVRITWVVAGEHQTQVLKPDAASSRHLPKMSGRQPQLL